MDDRFRPGVEEKKSLATPGCLYLRDRRGARQTVLFSFGEPGALVEGQAALQLVAQAPPSTGSA